MWFMEAREFYTNSEPFLLQRRADEVPVPPTERCC